MVKKVDRRDTEDRLIDAESDVVVFKSGEDLPEMLLMPLCNGADE